MISVSCTLISCQPASCSSVRSLSSAHQSCLAVSAALQQKWRVRSIRGDWHMRQRHGNRGWKHRGDLSGLHVHNLQLSSAGSVLCSYCNLWLSTSAWMNSRRSAVWSVIRYGWFKVEMECPADANWADISAVFTSLGKNHIIIGLKGGGFKARLRTKNNWKAAPL